MPPGPGPVILALPADLRIGAVAELFGQFKATDANLPLSIDASAVAKVDAAGMQAVLAGLLVRGDQRNWTWISPAEPFVRAARLLGLQQEMALST